VHPDKSAPGDSYRAHGFGTGCAQDQGALVQGRAGCQDIVHQKRMFSAHVAILAQRECVAQVLHSFGAIELCLRLRVPASFDAAHNRDIYAFRDYFGESVRLIESALSQPRWVKRHWYDAICRHSEHPCIVHCLEEAVREYTAQVILSPVLEAMNQVSQDTFRLIFGNHAIIRRGKVFTVWTFKFPVDKAFERPRTPAAIRCFDTRRCRFASGTEQGSGLLRISAGNTIRGIEQLKQCVT